MKFVITAQQRAVLMEHLDSQLCADANADETAYYPIVSLYYDNAERDCYWEKVRGLRSRRKFRVRVYGSLDGKLPPTVFVEVKHKYEGRGVKRRVRLPIEEALRVGEGKWPDVPLSEVDKRTVHEVIDDLVIRRGFRPVMVMRYDRRAYASVDPAIDLRVTYDTGIAYRLDNLVPVPDDRRFERQNFMYPDDVSVLEVKITGTIPYKFSQLLSATGCKLRSHSKYCNALERSDPVLQAMLAPDWLRAHLSHGDIEMDMIPAPGPGAGILEPMSAPAIG